jgi:pimeloyl-ACP methyl ester carboxylesterase
MSEGIENTMIGTVASSGPVTSPTAGSFLDVDGIRTFFVERGDGEAVVRIHGAGPGACAQISWQPSLDPLAKAGFWVIAYDQPGFGHSGLPADHSLEYRVRHARAFVDALGLTHYHLVGSSAGAYVAARLALDDPRVDRLVLVSGTGLARQSSQEADARALAYAAALPTSAPTLESVRALTLESLYHRELVTEELVQARFEMSSGIRFEAQLGRRAAAPQRSIVDELPKLAPRTLVLWGKNDPSAPVERALLLFDLIPGAELHVFDQCGHQVQWDQAARFNRILGDFLQAGTSRP